MIDWEKGLSLSFRGLNGLKGPGLAAGTSFPSGRQGCDYFSFGARRVAVGLPQHGYGPVPVGDQH